VLRARQEVCLAQFLPYFLHSDQFHNRALEISVGSLSPTINWSTLKLQQFELPSIEEQQRIVELLSGVDAHAEALRNQLHVANETRKSVLHHLLTAGGDDWTETTLGDVATWGSGGTPKSGEHAYYDGDIPWCVIGDLTEGEVFLTEKRITSEGLKNSSAKIVEPGAVMIAMYGASIGRTGIVGQPMATNQAIAFAYPSVETLNNWFLLLFLQTQKSQFVEAGQGAAQPNISQTVLKAWPILLPPLDEQARIVEIVLSIDDVIQETASALAATRQLRSALLNKEIS
jgi:type I restriction enzyme S subunit